MTKDKTLLPVCLGFLLIGAIFFCIGWGMLQYRSRKKRVCTQPVIQQKIQQKGIMGENKDSYLVGEIRILMVNLRNTNEIYDPEDSYRLLSKIFLLVGILLPV